MRKHLLVLILAFGSVIGFGSFAPDETTPPVPTNLHVVTKTSNSILFDWDDCGCSSSSYTVKYVRISDGYTSPEFDTGNSQFTFGNLQPSEYMFYFRVNCNGSSSGFIGQDDLIAM
ncbi:MAG: hypothetical protein GC192_17060 [Bacteroidetes bacterium]|nr:hypothetical protein [Bacteroidota bacterium]